MDDEQPSDEEEINFTGKASKAPGLPGLDDLAKAKPMSVKLWAFRNARWLLKRAWKHIHAEELKQFESIHLGEMTLKQKHAFESVLTKALMIVANEDNLSKEDQAIDHLALF